MDLNLLREIFPFDHHYVDVGGPRMHYLDEGEGHPVVMVHGNPTWSFFFRKLVEDLRGSHRVIVPDHIGCGLSEKPQRYAYTLGQHIDNLERLIDSLEIESLTLVVHDWGAAIGMGYAVRHPEKIDRLVVLNGGAFFCGKAPARIRLCIAPGLGDILVRGFNAFVIAANRMASVKPERMTPEVKAGYLFPYSNWASRVAVLGFVRDIPRHPGIPSHAVLTDIESKLHTLKDRPMMICWGDRDFCFHEKFLLGWQERFPDATVHRFEDAGHYILDDAHEKVVPLVRDFLSGTGSRSEGHGVAG